MEPEILPIVVIGAGGAGLIAAWKSALMGAPVLLLERNRKPAIKLLISGGGKCNVTHEGSMEELRGAFTPRQGRFLKHAFYAFTNADVRTQLARSGVETYARENGRVFPKSGRASDVVEALVSLARSAGADIHLDSKVDSVFFREGIIHVAVGGEMIRARKVIIATGGASYRKTGTTGDGFTWAAGFGHTIIPIGPALAPIRTRPPLPEDWRGIALRNGRLDIYCREKKLAQDRGDVLFSHEGISGPAALALSRTAASSLLHGETFVRYDFFPDLDFHALDEKLNRMVLAARARKLTTILEELLPNRMIDRMLESIRVSSDARGYTLRREERKAIVQMLKSWSIGAVEHVDVDRGEVTSGGVSLDEVDPRTMESRKVRGLHLAGEVLDIDGPIGGYNLQAAFSTGFVAGESAANSYRESARGR
ncbi:MAG TPA: aminoacetone oxidase family FAD-binding enzyme [Bacteroidota bacterium]|nr:aminoacetone oxidase family FAD-binding enzyme [Bacteroidota bacterium]